MLQQEVPIQEKICVEHRAATPKPAQLRGLSADERDVPRAPAQPFIGWRTNMAIE